MYVSTSVKFNINILKWKENYSMHISQDHHLDRQVLQFWKALRQFNDNVQLIIDVDEQGLDRLPHCCKTDCPKTLHKN